MSLGQFFVYQFFSDGTRECMAQRVGSRVADMIAECCVRRPAAMRGFIHRIIVTDHDDRTVFEWLFGKGVVSPPRNTGENYATDNDAR